MLIDGLLDFQALLERNIGGNLKFIRNELLEKLVTDGVSYFYGCGYVQKCLGLNRIPSPVFGVDFPMLSIRLYKIFVLGFLQFVE